MSIGHRMKKYEDSTRSVLPIRMPAILRLDGRAFHTFCKDLPKPYCPELREAMVQAATVLLKDCGGRLAYIQSDECSILLIDYNKFNSQPWLGGVVQKIVSVAASVFTEEFAHARRHRFPDWEEPSRPAYFDARVYPIPERDVENYFLWRQQDCFRNAISSISQTHWSQRQLHGESTESLRAHLEEIGDPETNYSLEFRYGTVIDSNGDRYVHRMMAEAVMPYLAVEEE